MPQQVRTHPIINSKRLCTPTIHVDHGHILRDGTRGAYGGFGRGSADLVYETRAFGRVGAKVELGGFEIVERAGSL